MLKAVFHSSPSPLLDPDQVVRVTQVQFGEDRGGLQGLQQGIDEGEGVLILYCDGVEGPVIDAWPKTSVPLPDKEEPGAHRRRGGPDYSHCQGALNIALHS